MPSRILGWLYRRLFGSAGPHLISGRYSFVRSFFRAPVSLIASQKEGKKHFVQSLVGMQSASWPAYLEQGLHSRYTSERHRIYPRVQELRDVIFDFF